MKAGGALLRFIPGFLGGLTLFQFQIGLFLPGLDNPLLRDRRDASVLRAWICRREGRPPDHLHFGDGCLGVTWNRGHINLNVPANRV